MLIHRTSAVHAAMAAHCMAALRAIAAVREHGEQLPRIRYRTITHDGPNATRGTIELRTLWSALGVLPTIPQLGTYEVAVRALTDDPVAGPQLTAAVGTRGSETITEAHRAVEDFVAAYLDLRQGIDWDIETFEAVYERFERHWYDSEVSFLAAGPLYGFWSEVEEIPLGPDLRIRPLTAKEQNRLLEQLELFEYLERPHGLTHPKYCLQLRWRAAKLTGAGPVRGDARATRGQAHALFPRVLDALRLFKPGAVGCPYIGVLQEDWPPRDVFFAPVPEGGGVSPGQHYQVDAAEIDGFRAHWKWFADQDLRGRPRAALAIRRFGLAYERTRQEDRLIDHVIALEALLDDGDRQELSYRLSLRSAAIIGRDAGHRREVFDRMRFAYDARSKVAHGGRLEEVPRARIGGIDLNAFFTLFESDIRAIIVEFLRLASAGEAGVLRELDEHILEGRFRDDLPHAGSA